MIRAGRRAGISLLEVQVALVVLGIGLAGLGPMVVMQLKLVRRFESTSIGSGNPQVIRGQRLLDGTPHGDDAPVTVLQPSADLWVRRIGSAAPFRERVQAQPSTALTTEATVDDAAATFSGAWTLQAADDATGGAFRLLNAGDTTPYAAWSIGSITPGRYRVMFTWPATVAIPTDATFTLIDADSNEVTVSASGATGVDGGNWRDLGNFTLGASFAIRLNGSLTGQVAADAVRIGARNTVTISSLSDSDAPPSDQGAARRARPVTRP